MKFYTRRSGPLSTDARGVCTWLVFLFLGGVPAYGQLVLHEGVFGTAGGFSEGGGISLLGAVGAPTAATPMTGGQFSVTGGFVAAAGTGVVPTVVHQAPDVVDAGVDIPLVATAGGPVDGALLHYRPGGAPGYQTVAMQEADGAYTVTISGADVGSRGISYFITVEDELGRTFRTPPLGTFDIRVRLADEGLARAEPQPSGSDQRAYRLVSFPIQPDDPRPRAVLEDDFGPYDADEWRFFGLRFDQEYLELPAIESLQAGEGYFLITRQPNQVMDTGPGVTTPTGAPFLVMLHPRWNLIGTPFNFDVPLAQVSLSSGRPLALRSLRDGWNDPVRAPVAQMRPFEGYAIFNDLQRVDTLLIYPHPRGAAKSSSGVVAGKSGADANEWTLHLRAETERALDADNAVGVRASAQKGLDPLDFIEPPAIGDFVAAYFRGADGGDSSERLSVDFRDVSDTDHRWLLNVEVHRSEAVTLTFEGVETLPGHLEAWLVDELLEVAIDLRRSSRYQLAPAPGTPRGLTLLVGEPSFVQEHRPIATELPSTSAVTDVFPNPFSTAASIRYALSDSAPVWIRVYNSVGAEVARLREGESQHPGRHVVLWDGSARDGRPAPSGVYFVRMMAGNLQSTQKVVLIR